MKKWSEACCLLNETNLLPDLRPALTRLTCPDPQECVPVCGFGTYSPSGLVPCLECPRSSFTMAPPPDGFRECASCPPGTFTHAQAANDQTLCRGDGTGLMFL